MKHARSDYDCIQPWPTKRPHYATNPVTGNKQPWNSLHDGAGLAPIIPDDEPVFLIRGQDLAAVATMEKWCEVASLLGSDREIIQRVLDHIHLVKEWQKAHVAKVPDLP